MPIRVLAENIAVYLDENQGNGKLILNNCVGIKRVRVYDITKKTSEYMTTCFEYPITKGTILYVNPKEDTFKKYMNIDNKCIYFVSPSDFVAIEQEDK